MTKKTKRMTTRHLAFVAASLLMLAVLACGTGDLPIDPDAALATGQAAAGQLGTLEAVAGPTLSAAMTSLPGTATALAPTAEALVTQAAEMEPTLMAMLTSVPQNLTPVSSAEAEAAIRQYGTTVLGIDPQISRAGGIAGGLPIPPSVQQNVDASISIAGSTYLAELSNGAASVSLGSGSVSGDLLFDIQSASLGVFTIFSTVPMPADEAGALALINSTFPGVAGQNFSPTVTEGPGYSFYAQSSNPVLNPFTGEYSDSAQAISAGVAPGAGRRADAHVWIVVARGDFAASLQP